jgi:hypothetical protein
MKTIERNNYKEISTFEKMHKSESKDSHAFNFVERKKMKKRGQTSIFVIVAILVVVAVAFLFIFVPDVRTFIGGEVTPSGFLADCLEKHIDSNIAKLSKQGGYLNPEGSVLYKGVEVKYLCYSAQYHEICNVQQPIIKTHFEQELGEILNEKVRECVASLKEDFVSRGFSVSGGNEADTGVVIVPGNIVVSLNAPMSASKGDATQSFSDFNFVVRSEMYDLLMISTSILSYESTYGDAETNLYTQYYPNLIIHKVKLGDGSTVYTVGDVTTDEEFTFASRSLAWPGGFGLEA